MGPPAIVGGAILGVALIGPRRHHNHDDGGARQYHEYQARIQKEEAERQKKLDDEKKRIQAEENRIKKEKEELEKKMKEEKEKIKREKELEEKRRKDEEEARKRQKQEKIKNANKSYQNKKTEYENKKLNFIKDEFSKTNFCSNQSYKLIPYIKEEVPKILKNLDFHIQTKINSCYSDNLNNLKNIPKTKNRILLIGKTGVGKSTLINGIFNADLAEEGFGKPITMHEKPKKYEYETLKDIELYDSRGIEIYPQNDVETIYNKIKEFIDEQFQKNEPIDAIWYCLTGTRVEDVELKLIKKLKSLYQDNSLSSVIVYTQCYFNDDFINMKNILNSIDNELIIHNVVAKMKKMGDSIIKSFGLEDLIEKTKNLIKQNSKFVLISTAKAKSEKQIQELINQKINFPNNIEFNQLIEKIINLFFENYSLEQNIKNIIQEFLSKYNIKCQSIIEENLRPIIEKEAKIITDELKNIVSNILREYDNVISVDQNGFYEEYKKKVNNLLLPIAQTKGKHNLNLNCQKIIENEIKNYLINKSKNYILSI